MESERTAMQAKEPMAILSDYESRRIVSQLSDDIGQLQILSNKVNESESAARKASRAVDTAKQRAAAAKGRVDSLGGVRAFHKRQAIEDLQDAVGDLADAQTIVTNAQIDLAEAQKSFSEAQRVTFECQEKIGNLTKAMVQIGCASIATSQLTVRELEAQMNGASREKLSELARNELLNVVAQIKSQQSLLGRQAQIEDILKEHDELLARQEKNNIARDKAIVEQAEKGVQQERKIAAQSQKLNEHQQLIDIQAEKDIEHDQRLDEGEVKDKAQDEELERQAEKDIEHDRLLAEGVEKDKLQDEELERQAEKDAEHDRLLSEGIEKDKLQDEKLERQAEKDAEHDKLLETYKEQINAQEILIQDISGELTACKQRIGSLEEELSKNSAIVNQLAPKTLALAALLSSAAAVLLGIIHFFI